MPESRFRTSSKLTSISALSCICALSLFIFYAEIMFLQRFHIGAIFTFSCLPMRTSGQRFVFFVRPPPFDTSGTSISKLEVYHVGEILDIRWLVVDDSTSVLDLIIYQLGSKTMNRAPNSGTNTSSFSTSVWPYDMTLTAVDHRTAHE